MRNIAKKRPFWGLSLIVGILISSCSTSDNNASAIRDFSPTLQPFLLSVVSIGVVGNDTATRYIDAHATDDELKLLSRSEHPILRAVALEEMLRRPGFDHFSLIMNELDDTAIVNTDGGEWGVRFTKIADYILENGRWKTDADKKRTIAEIITRHNNLRSAYTVLSDIELQENYYPFIKDMARRKRPSYEEREYALYALARYRKKEDIPILKEILLSYCHQLTASSFRIMKEFPDTTYMEVLRNYYPRIFYRSIAVTS